MSSAMVEVMTPPPKTVSYDESPRPQFIGSLFIPSTGSPPPPHEAFKCLFDQPSIWDYNPVLDNPIAISQAALGARTKRMRGQYRRRKKQMVGVWLPKLKLGSPPLDWQM
eukprot:7754740-Pyramimonas_sp.AAC.1